MNAPAELKKLSSEQLWAKVNAAHEAVEEERKRGVGVAAIIHYENLIHEIVSRIQYVGPPVPAEEWAISDDEENWGCCEDHSSRGDAVAALKDYAEEYGVEPNSWLYVTKKTPCNDMLADCLKDDKSSSYLICADDLMNYRIHEHLELHEDCAVSKDDTQDLQHRLRLTLQEWNRACSPFGGWWYAQHVEEFWWDGETVVPRNARKDWKGAQKGA